MDNVDELLTRGVANIIPNKDQLTSLLHSGKKLNIYLGIDPTATKIHLGHAVPLRKLQELADLGHNVTFLIGDFTALIGDTSDKDTERPLLTSEQVQENFKTYKKQAEKIVDFSKITVVHNSDWLSKLNFKEVIKLCAQFSFGDFASRELIAKRLKNKDHVGLHEALYPAMQGYDSYYMDTDIQVGGTDQTFNMQAGRILQKKWRNKESFVLATEFLSGTDGKKMSKTGGNAIWLEDTAENMFGKVMSLGDDVIVQYATLGTKLSLEKVDEYKKRLTSKENPMNIKKDLAKEIVAEMYSNSDATKAQEVFESRVQKKEIPIDIPTFFIPESLTSGATISDAMLAMGTVSSKSEAKRLVEQGAVTYDSTLINEPNAPFVPIDTGILKVGKRKFVETKFKE